MAVEIVKERERKMLAIIIMLIGVGVAILISNYLVKDIKKQQKNSSSLKN